MGGVLLHGRAFVRGITLLGSINYIEDMKNNGVANEYVKSIILTIAAIVFVLFLKSYSSPQRTIVASNPTPPMTLANQSPIDLGQFYNARLADSWLNPEWSGNTLENLAPGRHSVKGIQFDVRGVLQLQGQKLRLVSPQFPTNALGILVGRPFRRIFLFHGTVWTATQNAEIAALRLHYEDGADDSVFLKFGYHVRDWWSRPGDSKRTPGSWIAWTGRNPRTPVGVELKLYATMFNNPHPEKKVRSVDFCSTMSDSAPFLLAMTVE